MESTVICKVTVAIFPICAFLRQELFLKEKILEGVHLLSNPVHSKNGLQFQNEPKIQSHMKSSHLVGKRLERSFSGFHLAEIQRLVLKDAF